MIQQAKTHLAGADNRDQLFELGHLSRVGCLVPQHPYMVRQAATVNIVRPFTQEVEHLRKSEGNQKVVGGVRVADKKEQR